MSNCQFILRCTLFWCLILPMWAQDNVFLENITLPKGFSITLMTNKVNNAYGLAVSPKGRVFVGTHNRGYVYAVEDKDGDGKAENVYTLARGLKYPAGMAYQDGTLYIGTADRIVAIDSVDSVKGVGRMRTLVRTLPSSTHNGKRTLGFGPDGLIYITLGAPCNGCNREAETFATIARLKPGSPRLEVFAYGARFAADFAWHPQTKELWFVDISRSGLDKVMPDELNHAPSAGLHFGFPYQHGKDVADPLFSKGRDLKDFTKPARELGTNVNPMGMVFYSGAMFPPEYKNTLFIAENGSQFLDRKTGYRITQIVLRDNRVISYKPFAEGWLSKQSGSTWGQPVDVAEMPDGALVVADSKADAVYKITYR